MSYKKIIRAAVTGGLKTRAAYYSMEEGDVFEADFKDEVGYKKLSNLGVFYDSDIAALKAFQARQIPVVRVGPQVQEVVVSPPPPPPPKQIPERKGVPNVPKFPPPPPPLVSVVPEPVETIVPPEPVTVTEGGVDPELGKQEAPEKKEEPNVLMDAKKGHADPKEKRRRKNKHNKY